ncbi:hypothetical protein [Petroclostridium sp. X23]|uniref:hypothetical protein n=1 Tax=Petroclostridium sp. X23 TaxID=3045146 RepID=UPI0024AC827F|nr:hypothetical protein [Petroclostridium sp. X23]WHH58126.1 hypothetical protein QKW49_20330 [Petroclostridium sp. X23]
MRRNNSIKKSISMKRFIVEFGKDFSEHMKERLLELEVRCVLTRKENINRLDLKHVEHIQYDCESASEDALNTCQKELSYGQFIMVEGELFYSEKSEESEIVMQSPIINAIYHSLNTENTNIDSFGNAKRIDDSNIDYVMDTLLSACPEVSQSYLNIMSKYL